MSAASVFDADPAGLLDRLDVAEQEAVRVRGALDALAVIGLDPFEVEPDQLGRGQLLRQDGAVDVRDGRLLEMEARRGGERPQREPGDHNGTKRFPAHFASSKSTGRQANIVAKAGSARKG